MASPKANSPGKWTTVASLEELRKNSELAFALPGPGGGQGFVVIWRGRCYAYRNRCCHHPLPLDFGDGRFLSRTGGTLRCQNHGAEYAIPSGECVQGPCLGAFLESFPVRVEEDQVQIQLPQVD